MRVNSLHLDTLAEIKRRLDRFVAQWNLADQSVLHILLSQILPDMGEDVDMEDMGTELMEITRQGHIAVRIRTLLRKVELGMLDPEDVIFEVTD